MSCNCNSGDTPEYYITLDGVGADGYSPEINIINEDTKSFELELVNKNNTQITSAIPKLTYLEGTYVSNSSLASTLANYSTTAQIATTYLSKSDAATTYLKVDGSNANNPITIDGLQIRNNSGYITLGTGTTTTINTQARAINFVETDSNGDQQSLIQMGSTGSINVRAAGTLTLGGSGTRPGYSQAGGAAKSLALYTDIPDVTSKLNTDGSNASNPITIDGHTFESLYGGLNTKLTMTGSPAYIEAPTLVLRSTDTGKVYYKSSDVNNEIATIGDINDATITITQGGVTKGSFTLNQSGNATIALDAGGSASTNPIVLKTTDESRSLALGLDNDTKKAYMTYTISTGGMNLPLPVRLIAGKSAPITLTETNEGLTTIGLDYDTNSLGLDTNNKLAVDSDYVEAHKAYLADGDTLTDPQGLQDVEYYNHSSFDSSKFTIVGSPTITTDGIASGFSANDYLTVTTTKTLSKDTYFKLSFKFKTPSSWTKNGRFFGKDNYLYFGHTANGVISGYFLNASLNTTGFSALANSTDYVADFIYNSTGFYVQFKKVTDATYTTTTPVTITSDDTKTLTGVIGNQANNRNNYFTGSIDLKYFSMTVDGVEVFSGNKTGIDTIKPDNYTVVGTPTISADGILTVSDGSNYVSGITPAMWNGKSWRLEFDIDFNASTTVSQRFMKFAGYRYDVFNYNPTWNSIYVQLYDTDNVAGGNAAIEGIRSKFIAGKIHIKLYFDYTTGEYYFTAQQGNGAFYESSHKTLANKNLRNQASNLFYGNLYNYDGENPAYGTLDLNSIKFYNTDGKLVYQPCLKIPYTLSKTGSKIVNAIYRDRVNDMASQFGYAPYYTLDETNGNFTLPMGEIYGYITRLESIVKDLQTRLTALESNIDAGGAGVVQQGLLGMSPLSLARPQLLGEFNPEDEMNTMDIEPIEDDIQEEEIEEEPQETEEEPIEETVEEQEEPQEEGGQDE